MNIQNIQTKIQEEPNPKLRRHMLRILETLLELKEFCSPELFQKYIQYDIVQLEKQIPRLNYKLGGVYRSDYFRKNIEVCKLVLDAESF